MPRGDRGFTLIEVMIVIVVIAILASIVIPRLLGASRESKEANLRQTLKQLRNSIGLFQAQTRAYPGQLADIMLPPTSPPATGLDVLGNSVAINATDYKGPYVTTADGNLPDNVVTGGNVAGTDWLYSTTSPTVGDVHAAAGQALDGSDYSMW